MLLIPLHRSDRRWLCLLNRPLGSPPHRSIIAQNIIQSNDPAWTVIWLTFANPKCGNFSNDRLNSSPPMYIRVAATVWSDMPSPRNMMIFLALFSLRVASAFNFLEMYACALVRQWLIRFSSSCIARFECFWELHLEGATCSAENFRTVRSAQLYLYTLNQVILSLREDTLKRIDQGYEINFRRPLTSLWHKHNKSL